MGLLDKAKFWKKDTGLDDLNLGIGDNLNVEIGQPLPKQDDFSGPANFPDPFGEPRQQQPQQYAPPFSQQRYTQQQQYSAPSSRDRDLETISAKLDTIRAMVENISQRLEMLERQNQQEPPRRPGW